MLFVCGWLMDRFDANRVLALAFSSGHGDRRNRPGAWLRDAAGHAAPTRNGRIRGFPCYSNILATHFGEEHRGFANGIIIAGMKLGPVGGTLEPAR